MSDIMTREELIEVAGSLPHCGLRVVKRMLDDEWDTLPTELKVGGLADPSVDRQQAVEMIAGDEVLDLEFWNGFLKRTDVGIHLDAELMFISIAATPPTAIIYLVKAIANEHAESMGRIASLIRDEKILASEAIVRDAQRNGWIPLLVMFVWISCISDVADGEDDSE